MQTQHGFNLLEAFEKVQSQPEVHDDLIVLHLPPEYESVAAEALERYLDARFPAEQVAAAQNDRR